MSGELTVKRLWLRETELPTFQYSFPQWRDWAPPPPPQLFEQESESPFFEEIRKNVSDGPEKK